MRGKNNGQKRKLLVGGLIMLVLVLGIAVLAVILINSGSKNVPSSSINIVNSAPPAPSQSDDAPVSSLSESQSEQESQAVDSAPASSETSSESQSEAPPPEPPVFVETPTVKVEKGVATVTFKTNVKSTVNSIIATSADRISTGTFYDYVRRDKPYTPAIGKAKTFNVDENGKTEQFTIPDLRQSYWLLINAVEDEGGLWQSGVTVIQLYEGDPNAPAPSSSSDSGSGSGSSSSS